MSVLYKCIWEKNDIRRVEKLLELTDPGTFWDDVRKLTSKITSDHSIHRWEHLAGLRYEEITEEVEA